MLQNLTSYEDATLRFQRWLGQIEIELENYTRSGKASKLYIEKRQLEIDNLHAYLDTIKELIYEYIQYCSDNVPYPIHDHAMRKIDALEQYIEFYRLDPNGYLHFLSKPNEK